MMEEAGVAEVPAGYRAFISYSHADSRFAGWLHRRLEGWTVPGEGRLAPIFLDRAELAAGPDLSASVREALRDSAALLVVASPSARASRWVAQEVALFRELHPDRPILAALVDGEPGEAFPDALVANGDSALEPLAADFRERRDGKRLGLLKIVAGLTGQPLDRLVQRDAQARQRRVMWITAAALLLSLILAALLVMAVRARAEAQRQRGEAEGLVEFMLTDLRDKLKGTGSPTIMAAVNQRALTYYSQQDLDSLPDPSLDRRARVLHAMGEDNERLGNFPAAQKMYAEAWRITDEVLKRHPDDADAIFAHAQSEYWVGEAAWKSGELDTAGLHWRAYAKQAQALSKLEPGTKRSWAELGYAEGNMCEFIHRSTHDPQLALEHCIRSSADLSKARNLDPEDRTLSIDLANRLGWQSDVLAATGRHDEALAARDDEEKIIKAMIARSPADQELRERLLWPQVGRGKIFLEAGVYAQAEKALAPAFATYRQMFAEHSGDTGLGERYFRAGWLLARTFQSAGKPVPSELVQTLQKRLDEIVRTHQPEQAARYRDMAKSINLGDAQ